MKPLISVIVATYNQAEFIDQCIQSILNQSYKNFELFVINGSSTDNTEKVVMKYKNQLNYIHTPFNEQHHKLNIGFRAAQGRFLSYCASDDFWHKDFLKECVMAHFETEADVVYTSFNPLRMHKDAKWGYSQVKNMLEWQDWGGYTKLIDGNVCGCFYMFTKKVYEQVNGFDAVPYADWDFCLKACEDGMKFHYVKKKLGTYRIHMASDSTRINLDIQSKENARRLKATWQDAIVRLNRKGIPLPKRLQELQYQNFISPEPSKKEDWHVKRKGIDK